MPSHKIHLAIAKMINEKMHMDLDSLMIGSVLPDLTISKNHSLSHFQVEDNYEDELANPNKFIKEYEKEMKNPIMIGYLIHLLTDKFYNDYFFKKHCIFDENGKPYAVKLKNGKIKDCIKKYKHGDFDKYDKWLLKNKYVVKFENNKCLNNVFDLNVAKYDKNFLKEYIIKSNKEVDKPKKYKNKSFIFYKVMNKKELDKLFDECIKYIYEFLKDNNVIT